MRLPKFFLVSSVLCALSFAARAQTTSPPTEDPSLLTWCADLAANTAAELSFEQQKLALTSGEQSAWGAYSAGINSGLQTVETACAALPNPLPTDFPSLFAARASIRAARVAADQTMAPVISGFYAVLTSNQQTIYNHINDRHGVFGAGF